MTNKKRPNSGEQAQRRDIDLNPFPGITGEGAEETVARPTGAKTDGLFSDPGDGTIGEVGERYRERAVGDIADHDPRDHNMTAGTSISPISDLENEETSGSMNSDITGQLPHDPGGGSGTKSVGDMGSGTGRGRGSGTPGGVAGGGDSAGTGGMGGGFDSQVGTGGANGGLGTDVGGGLTGGTGGQGLPRRSDMTSTGGGVAVSGGRGSDVGSVGGGMAPDLSPRTSGGMSGGTFGGSRESDLGGGLSGGMRSGTGSEVSGSRGNSDDETAEGDRQRSPRRRSRFRGT